MQRSPCLECEYKGADKRNPTCTDCQKRKDYVASIGGLTASVPVELTNMGRKMGSGRTWKKWTEDDVNFLKENVNRMTNKQMADHLGRPVTAVAGKLSVLNIKRNSDFKPGVVFENDNPKSNSLLTSDKIEPVNNRKNFFIVDFSKYGDLYDRFLSFANKNFRTAENQILYLVSQALKEDGN